jgi:hypothetical protein
MAMEGTLSAFAAVMSVVALIVTAVISYRLNRRGREERVEDLALRFREPLLQSAHNLQSRLYNIVRQDFLGRFLTAPEASQQERDYAVRNTQYLFGQYLGWVEVIRRESQYIDPRSRKNSQTIVERLEAVRSCMAESTRPNDRPLRLFRGEQRAVGELMLVPTPIPTSGDVPRWECLGYAAFVEALDDPRFHEWFAPLEEGINGIASLSKDFPLRITDLQHVLVDLMDALDPHCERVPRQWRARL